MRIGQLLKHIRINMGISQKEMADRLDISQNYLSLIESEKKRPSTEKLGDFARALKISKEALQLASAEVPKELGDKDKRDFQKLQRNIVTLLLFELTGELEQHA